jgi:hypothetical protein
MTDAISTRTNRSVRIGKSWFLLPFKASGSWVEDARGADVAEARNAEIAKALAQMLNEQVIEVRDEVSDSMYSKGWR